MRGPSYIYLLQVDRSGVEGVSLIKVGTSSNVFATLSRFAEQLDGVTLIGLADGGPELAQRAWELVASVALDVEIDLPLIPSEAEGFVALPGATADALRLSLQASLGEAVGRQWSQGEPSTTEVKARHAVFLADIMRGCGIERPRVYSRMAR